MNKDDLTKKELNKVSGGDDHLNDAQDPFEVEGEISAKGKAKGTHFYADCPKCGTEGETGHPCPKCGTMIW